MSRVWGGQLTSNGIPSTYRVVSWWTEFEGLLVAGYSFTITFPLSCRPLG